MAWWLSPVASLHLLSLRMNLSSGDGLVREVHDCTPWMKQCLLISSLDINVHYLFQAPLRIQRRISVHSASCGWTPKIWLLRYLKYYSINTEDSTMLCYYVDTYHYLFSTDREWRTIRDDFPDTASVSLINLTYWNSYSVKVVRLTV